MIVFVDGTPYKWFSRRQTSIETSSYMAEFAALRVSVEQELGLCYTLRSMGIVVGGPTRIVCDNSSVCTQDSEPVSPLSQKHIAICFHKVRETVDTGAVNIWWIPGKKKSADILTKQLSTWEFHGHVRSFMDTEE